MSSSLSGRAACEGPVLEGRSFVLPGSVLFTEEQLRAGIRGKYAERYAQGVNLVRLDPDVAAVFPDSEAVNQALRALADVIRQAERRSA